MACLGTISSLSHADESILLAIGPRIGFATTSPLMGKQQTVDFHLYDLAALWRLPWHTSWHDGRWEVGTRLLTSGGVIEGADTTGLIATVVPDVGLSGWNGLASLDVGIGAGFLSRHRFGVQDFGGAAQIVGISPTGSLFLFSAFSARLSVQNETYSG